ncbi:hypothetical protein BYT27DRAFT_7103692 [Phlegmacium glaucopus]|nr:hypothetical protein BYT27DRAFT_7103692 [Phlegmacium glaucopus]
MRRELDVSKHDLARAQADTTRLEERCKMLEKTLKDTREVLRSREAELDRLRRERDRERVERRRSDVGPRNSSPNKIVYPRGSSSLDTRITSTDIQHWHRPQSPSSSSISSHGTLPDEERARIRSSESYLSRIDSWSGAQVLQAVHDINSEILQFAASATEVSTFSTSRTRPTTAIQDTTARIGPYMTRILSGRDHSQDPLLVQLALQGCVSLCIARALSSFCIGFPSKSDAVLAQLYSHIHLNEPQPTSAKWRSLTHQHIHAIYPTLTEYSVNELSDTILRWSADIFVVAGWQSFSSPTNNNGPITTVLRSLYFDQIKRISRSVLRLAKVAREDIMSTTFEVVVADPTQIFRDSSKLNSEIDLELDMDDATPNHLDKGGLNMVDAFAEYGESKGRVLATMELGLRCITRVGVVGGSRALQAIGEHSNGNGTSNAGDLGETRFEDRMLLLPKVVLESVLEVLDR